ncbi:hypothetical protein BURC_02696, partial [Burkholderiaceae bacterium]
PLFNAILNYRHSERGQGATLPPLPGIEVLRWQERTNYPIGLCVDDFGDGFELTAQVRSPVDAQRLCGYMGAALEGLVSALLRSPDTPLRQLDVLPADERRLLLDGWGRSAHPSAPMSCVHELIARQARRAPLAPAVVQGGVTLRYGELVQQADRLALRLRALGAGPDQRVAVCMPRGVAMVVAWLAVLKSGGAYVPLDPAYPPQRLALICTDSDPVAVLTLGVGIATVQALREAVPQAHFVDLGEHETHDEARSSMGGDEPRPEHLAYVVYTSGSTGVPKGVAVEHRQLVNEMQAIQRRYGTAPGDRILSVVSSAFDVAAEDVWGTLAAGATLVLPALQGAAALDDFWPLCRREEVTGVNLPAALWDQLGLDASPLPQPLRRVTVGGDRMTVAGLSAWFSRTRRPRLFNAYGPTETTVCATLHECDSAAGAAPIGRPIDNVRVYLLDEHGQPVPIGVAGELYIGGAGVARGYLNRPELTAERFVADPFSGEPGARMYRSGDLARWREDGNLEYLGRNDQQVKIRGFRIELGEIEAKLTQQPGVREAVVVATQQGEDKRLVAYVVGEAEELELDVASRRERLALGLPEYMLPWAYVQLPSLPLTPNGKLDRKALPEPGESDCASRGYEAPQGEVECTLARIWSELLQVQRVG